MSQVVVEHLGDRLIVGPADVQIGDDVSALGTVHILLIGHVRRMEENSRMAGHPGVSCYFQPTAARRRVPICPNREITSRASVRASCTAFSRSRFSPSVRLAIAPRSLR